MSRIITPAMLEEFRNDFNETVKGLEEKYGLSLKLGKITYGTDHFTSKLEAISCENGENHNQVEFNKYCRLYDLKPEDFGREFEMNGETYRISGVAPNRRKYPIKAIQLKTGKEYCVTLNSVRA